MKLSLVKIKQLADHLQRLSVLGSMTLSTCMAHSGDGNWQERSCPIVYGGGRTMWHFKQTVELPAAWREGLVTMRFDLDVPKDRTACEGLLFVNGRRSFGLDRNHKEYVLPEDAVRGGTLELEVEAFAGITENLYQFKAPQVCLLDPMMQELSMWLKNLAEAVECLELHDPAHYKLHDLLHDACIRLDLFAPRSDSFFSSVQSALEVIQGGLSALPRDGFAPTLIAVGHSHIDIAYLWTIADARRKSVHTFTTIMALMDQYPEFTYFQSMPQIYAYIEEDAPDLFRQIQARAQEGRWEVEGGMWVESDCNIPSGESLVRQFLHGMRYVKEKFGKSCEMLWMPDVFGYNAALPQILKQCGIRYFMTTKLSWNEVNDFPHDTFGWVGIDGSEVLAHYISAPERNLDVYTYNGFLDPKSVWQTWENYKSKAINDHLLIAFGHGDGGGGPTAEMVESGRRMAALPRLPQTKFGTALEYFRELERRVRLREDLPSWKGELYLEFHRGTYTSQAKNKRFNRQSEWLYREAELWGAVANFHDVRVLERLADGWKLILKNQFHDILPGSGIPEVFEDSDRDYEQILAIGREVLEAGLSAVASRIAADDEPGIVVFNSLPWDRGGWVEVDGRTLWVDSVPALGYRTISWKELEAWSRVPASASVGGAWSISTEKMENELIRILFAPNGQLLSVFDKQANREVLAPGEAGNVLELFEDRPIRNDAWNIDYDFPLKRREVTELVGVQVVFDNGLRGAVQFTWTWNRSTIVQKVIVHRDSKRIDFDTRVDWQERQVLLKAAFPVDVQSAYATYDIQFGNLQRSTLKNTSWDEAQFEMCAQKWVDLSEGGYGVSLLNDCKYGHDIKGHTMRITLIKSGIYPDPLADHGDHTFCYSLFPHQGSWHTAGTNREAYEVNIPLQARVMESGGSSGGRDLPKEYSYLQVEGEHVMLETVKPAEAGNGVILRFHEYGNQRGPVTVRSARPIKAVEAVNLLEEPVSPLAEADAFKMGEHSLEFRVTPYQIRTFRVVLG
ncbi:alpha-mannosidase [Paenibacillus cremeus]|uniref:Alpha-mannosidase n=1 Tax=Paenibacillus cremeus TaxID=2163881 RepID=A0A559K7T3_9BACL|nr:alpha-mannosidase [Paenibacillus cremeus]TVY08164.1 alpha-mannosidase [Paenibacillus cremeus]